MSVQSHVADPGARTQDQGSSSPCSSVSTRNTQGSKLNEATTTLRAFPGLNVRPKRETAAAAAAAHS
jgi:hypothetical protein